jgi:hypothetical protein
MLSPSDPCVNMDMYSSAPQIPLVSKKLRLPGLDELGLVAALSLSPAKAGPLKPVADIEPRSQASPKVLTPRRLKRPGVSRLERQPTGLADSHLNWRRSQDRITGLRYLVICFTC